MKNTDLSQDIRDFLVQAIEEYFTVERRPCFFPQNSHEWNMVMDFKQHLKSADSVEFTKEEVTAVRNFAINQCQTCVGSRDQEHAQKFLNFINELLEYAGYRRYESLGEFLHDYGSR